MQDEAWHHSGHHRGGRPCQQEKVFSIQNAHIVDPGPLKGDLARAETIVANTAVERCFRVINGTEVSANEGLSVSYFLDAIDTSSTTHARCDLNARWDCSATTAGGSFPDGSSSSTQQRSNSRTRQATNNPMRGYPGLIDSSTVALHRRVHDYPSTTGGIPIASPVPLPYSARSRIALGHLASAAEQRVRQQEAQDFKSAAYISISQPKTSYERYVAPPAPPSVPQASNARYMRQNPAATTGRTMKDMTRSDSPYVGPPLINYSHHRYREILPHPDRLNARADETDLPSEDDKEDSPAYPPCPTSSDSGVQQQPNTPPAMPSALTHLESDSDSDSGPGVRTGVSKPLGRPLRPISPASLIALTEPVLMDWCLDIQL